MKHVKVIFNCIIEFECSFTTEEKTRFGTIIVKLTSLDPPCKEDMK